MVHYSTHLSAPLNELCTIFRIEGHSEKSCIRLLTLERLRRSRFTEFVFHRITPCLSSARRVIVHERVYSIRRCYKGRPTSSRQPSRATVATSHSLWRVSPSGYYATVLPEGVLSFQTAAFGGCVRSE